MKSAALPRVVLCGIPTLFLLAGCATMQVQPMGARQVQAAAPSPASVVQSTKSAIAADPLNWRGYNELGITYYRQQRYDEAIAAFEQALALHPIFKVVEAEQAQQRYNEARRQAAVAAQQQAQGQQAANAALSLFGQALNMMSAMPGVDPMAANALQMGLQTGQGAVALDQALRPVPGLDLPDMPGESAFQVRQELSQLQANLGLACIGRRFFDRGVESLEKAIQLDPSRIEHLKELGSACIRLGQHEKAIAALNRYLALCPGTPEPDTFFLLTDAFAALGLTDVAAETFSVGVKGCGGTTDPARQSALAYAHMERGRYEEATAAYESSLAASRAQPQALRRLGICHYGLGRLDDAARVLAEAVTADDADDAARVWLAHVCEAQGRTNEAAAALQHVAARHPNLSKYDRPPVAVAAAYAATGAAALATEWLNAIIQENPGDRGTAYPLFELAHARLRAGRPADTMEALDRAVEVDPGAPYALRFRDAVATRTRAEAAALRKSADADAGAGRGAEAVAGYAKALALLPAGPAKDELRLKLLRLAASQKTLPPLSAGARTDFTRANSLLKAGGAPGDVDRAVMSYRSALRECPWNADLYLNLAVAYTLRHRYNEAITNMKLYLVAKPDAADAEAVVARLGQIEIEREQAMRAPSAVSLLKYRQYYGQ